MDISFHTASEDDFEQLLSLRGRVMRESLERIGRYDPARSRERFRDSFEPEFTRLIYVDGAMAGCVLLKDCGDHLQLGNFYIDFAWQSRGIGSQVLRMLLSEADARPVRLGVLKLSPAARFYERHGFVKTHATEFDDYYEHSIMDGNVGDTPV